MINSAQSFQLIIEVILVCVGFAFFLLYYWCIKLCSCNSRSQSDARLKTSANWARTLLLDAVKSKSFKHSLL